VADLRRGLAVFDLPEECLLPGFVVLLLDEAEVARPLPTDRPDHDAEALLYLSSGMHYGAGSHLDDMLWERRRWNGSQAYAETKFQDVLLAFAVARLFPGVMSNALEPGWVPTRMGGAGAPDDLDKGTGPRSGWQRATSRAATVSGRYFFHQKLRDPDPATTDVDRQGLLLELCRKVSGTAFPKS
jgi:NAD(P)-dependent dehydrogenase (short-subunit alcohol dehydrogenase family)